MDNKLGGSPFHVILNKIKIYMFFVVNSFYQKNGKAFFFGTTGCEFAWICKYLQASVSNTFKDMQLKI